ncbi:hypothetical protein MA16_Dca000934 [Dendrobium catenatum]|uniref:Uncharacterized protein n=1 Tax=Dendrobium catenatum TaxID=906689 RepID=A0A2I0WV94_9ASPA|nr:hypothetical protein MA16_Dca000934 [Dendrobium catenatum]
MWFNSKAIMEFPNAVIKHLQRVSSDHCPVLIQMEEITRNFKNDFRFKNLWCSYEAANGIIKKSWIKKDYGSANEVLQRKIKRLLKNLFYRSKNKLKELNDRNQLLKKEISVFQNKEAEEGGLNHGDLLLLRNMVTEFKTNLARIATWWKQRSKCQWMEEGKKNTSYYHMYA